LRNCEIKSAYRKNPLNELLFCKELNLKPEK